MVAASPAIGVLPPGRFRFSGALRAEWTKIRSVRSTAWCLLATVVAGIGIGILASASEASRWRNRTRRCTCFCRCRSRSIASCATSSLLAFMPGHACRPMRLTAWRRICHRAGRSGHGRNPAIATRTVGQMRFKNQNRRRGVRPADRQR